jgi:hypothetical protein
MSDQVHHIHCANQHMTHRGVCRDSQGEALHNLGQPISTEMVSKTGMPVGSIVAIQRPDNYSVSPEGLPNNKQTEAYLQSVGMLKPYLPKESTLEGGLVEGQKVSYTPDHPTIELNFSHPNGLEVHMTIQIPDEMRAYYDEEMALTTISNKMASVLLDISTAKRLDQESEPVGE